MATASVQLRLVPFLYFCHYSRDSKKNVGVHTQYCFLLLNFWRGQVGGLICKFCGCSVTSSRSVKENIGAVKICFCYSDFSSVSLILIM